MEYVRQYFLTSIEDGISFIETRIAFIGPFLTSTDGYDVHDNREVLLIVDRVAQEVKEEMKTQHRPEAFIGVKVIYCAVRSISPEELEWNMEDCISLKKEFPHLISGFDLVGDENTLKPLSYYLKQLLAFRTRQAEEDVVIPFFLHAGETLGDGTEADMNIYDAILLGTKRIGHGFSLVKHPKLMEICREKDIALEVCPISNEVLVK